MKNKFTRIAQASGFTLLEILVAVLVLSIGLLGIAGLMLNTVQNNSVSSQRTIATFLAQDMADRMRQTVNVNQRVVINKSDLGLTERQALYALSKGAATNCYGAAADATCGTPQGAANYNLYVWNQQVAASLPGGSAVVCQDLTPDDGLSFANPGCDATDPQAPWVVKVFWSVRERDGVSAGEGSVQRYVMFLGGM
jgi:type IV pilus assembly protein PilV